jgi:hypothetical protein
MISTGRHAFLMLQGSNHPCSFIVQPQLGIDYLSPLIAGLPSCSTLKLKLIAEAVKNGSLTKSVCKAPQLALANHLNVLNSCAVKHPNVIG